MHDHPPVEISHYFVAGAEFAQALDMTGRMLKQAQGEQGAVLAIEQDLIWYDGRIDRLGITGATIGDTAATQNLMSLPSDQFAKLGLLSVMIQCATTFNRPLNIACSDLAEGHNRRHIEAAAYFLDGAIVILLDDISDRVVVGALLIPTPEGSNHSQMDAKHVANRAAKFLETHLTWMELPARVSIVDRAEI